MTKLMTLSCDDPCWQKFTAKHATSPMQHASWLLALTRAYRLEARVVALTDSNDAILAGLPVVHGNLPWQRRWTSLPFTDTLEPPAVNSARRDELLAAVVTDAETRPILIRTRVALPGWSARQVGTVQVIDLSDGVEGVLSGADAHHRRSVKRAQRREVGLTARPITAKAEFLGASLRLIARSRRRLGAPTQPRRYWSQVWELHERGEAMTIGVYLGNELAANGVFLVGRDHAVYKYGASELATRQLRTNYLMFVSAFEHIAARGVRSMDFGITDLQNTSLRMFKARWGGEEQPAFYSATDARLLPDSLQPGPLLTSAVKSTPVFVGQAIGKLAYRFVA